MPVSRGDYVYSTNARRFGAGLVRLTPAGSGVTAEQVYFERDVPNTLGGQVLLGEVIYGTNQEGPAAADFATGNLYALTWLLAKARRTPAEQAAARDSLANPHALDAFVDFARSR